MFTYPPQSLQTPKPSLVGISKQWQYFLSLKYLLIYLLPFVLIRSTNAKKAHSAIPTNAIIIILSTTDSILIYFSFILYTIIIYFLLIIKRKLTQTTNKIIVIINSGGINTVTTSQIIDTKV